jgi:hypothetical protein
VFKPLWKPPLAAILDETTARRTIVISDFRINLRYQPASQLDNPNDRPLSCLPKKITSKR